MNYTAIIKDGGLFIPNVFSDIDSGAHIVQVEIDMEAVREQLNNNVEPQKVATKQQKKPLQRQTKKATIKSLKNGNEEIQRKSAVDELAAFDDSELSEMLKAYMNDGQIPAQISLENL